MANVYIKTASGGETTAPTGSEGIPLDDGTNSTWIQILNLVARKIRETGGPTTLSMGAIADGNLVYRSGSTLAGLSPFYPFDARLTLTSATPVTTANVTGATSVYLALYGGDKVALYDGSALWNIYTLTEQALSLSGLIKGVCYDVFLNYSGGFSLTATAWKKITASNSPTAGASKVINLSDTSTLAVGGMVTVKDGSNSEVTDITAVVASTSITVSNLSNSYTTPDVYGYKTRATALTTQNGIYVRSGATNKRYCGTIRITPGTTGQCEVSTTSCYVWNFYNRIQRHLSCVDATNSWTYTTATWRAANANTTLGTGRVDYVMGLDEDAVIAENYTFVSVSGNASLAAGIGVDATATNSANTFGARLIAASGSTSAPKAAYRGWPGIGDHYLQRLEISEAVGTTTWYGDNNLTYLQSGLTAVIWS